MKLTSRSENALIGLLSAVPSEGLFLAKKLKKIKTYPGFYPFFYKGNVGGKEVIYSVSGMGKTNAAHAATVLIRDYSPELLINFGVGGSYPSSKLAVGDIMVAEAEIYGDEGVLDASGFHGLEFIGIPALRKGKKKYFNEFALKSSLAEAAAGSAREAFQGASNRAKVKSGRFVTVSTATGTRKRAVELQKRWGGICENMEGAAIAHVCALHRIPMIEIRGVSNVVEDRDTGKWDLALAAENCCMAVIRLLKEIRIS